uniref:alkene reductase n=1 Tax=Paractinoplanes polyasparticus TaxID=2856853 RepID=UPI0021021FFF|nr:alkene reductase [Actinoplanes polyasparticus]
MNLLSSARLGDLTVPNRTVMSPMTRVRAGAGGLATPSMATYYAQRASAGLIISEGLFPNPVGQSNPGTPGLHSPAHAESWRQVTDAVHANGGRIFAQVQHAGRVSHRETTGLQPVAPSAVPLTSDVFTPTGPKPASEPRALDRAEVTEHAQAYASAARLAVSAGFDGVELHGANGYLIHQFLAPNANVRTDEYGGTVANRIRFAVEAVTAVAGAIGPSRTGIKLSPGVGLAGLDEPDAEEVYSALLQELDQLGLAYVHLESPVESVLLHLRKLWSGTMIVNPSMPDSSAPTDQATAERWLDQGADLISFGRAYLANPDLVERLRLGLSLAKADVATYYAGGDDGYLTYPTYQHRPDAVRPNP